MSRIFRLVGLAPPSEKLWVLVLATGVVVAVVTTLMPARYYHRQPFGHREITCGFTPCSHGVEIESPGWAPRRGSLFLKAKVYGYAVGLTEMPPSGCAYVHIASHVVRRSAACSETAPPA